MLRLLLGSILRRYIVTCCNFSSFTGADCLLPCPAFFHEHSKMQLCSYLLVFISSEDAASDSEDGQPFSGRHQASDLYLVSKQFGRPLVAAGIVSVAWLVLFSLTGKLATFP
jgi:hypothetical protein